jgi:hypothetical protein
MLHKQENQQTQLVLQQCQLIYQPSKHTPVKYSRINCQQLEGIIQEWLEEKQSWEGEVTHFPLSFLDNEKYSNKTMYFYQRCFKLSG